ncbi:MAG: PilZ domain-containing protein [Planctomycetota bacterium]|nr:PilZ domain-containing protein [Planctomycetota bacterium]MCX8039844.1 PilZ domain-containing protein [Planctomycetota bacterium]MDW8372825.1 PilZ domain-containing protein [Planctomycetota bacterium]
MNQREFSRVRRAVPVDCRLSDGRVLSGSTRDLSLNGCFAAGLAGLPIGTPCQAVLYLDGRGGALQVEAHAVVVRQAAEGCALHFQELVEVESYERLRQYIHWHADDPDQVDAEFESHLGLRRIDPQAPPPRAD